MDFSLTANFVVQPGNTLPTTGTTATLTPGQFGVYLPNATPATAGNIAAAKYFTLHQGRIEKLEDHGTKRSDRIYLDNVTDFYKVSAEETATVQITDFTDFVAHCDETVSITLRLLSYYIDTTYFNGLTRTLTVQTPCCDCDGDPCATLTDDQTQAMVDEFVAKINAEPTLKRFVVAQRLGTGLTSSIRVTGLPVDRYGNPCDISAFPFNYDRTYFWGFAYRGVPTSQDMQLYYDACDSFATVTVLQRAGYGRGSSLEVEWTEKDYWSYQVAVFKDISKSPAFNQSFQSYVADGIFYDQYVIEFKTPDKYTWASYVPQDERVIIYVPVGETAALEAILVAKLGPITDKSGPNVSTTTTTSTSSSSTTSTSTTLVP